MDHEQDRIKEEICEYMINNRQSFECFVDGSLDGHVDNHRYTDGKTSSWATEAEMCAASSLYAINVNVETDYFS